MRSWQPSAVTAVALPTALALGVNWATNTVQVNTAWWPPVVWATTIGLVAVSIWVEVARRRGETQTPPPTATQMDTLAEQLAQAVREQRRRDEEHRKVNDPVPLPVRWHPAPDDLVDDPANIRRAQLGHPTARFAAAGSLDQVAEVYRRIPSGRLVILGKLGAGKTVLAARLALDLLATRLPTEPVPMIFSMGSWNPTTPLRDWLADQLARDHPTLFAEHAGGSNLAAALIATDRILPILDGFDEVNPGLHAEVLRQLNTATGLPLVLTSRPEQYTAAVRTVDVLTHAEGIELDDLTLTDLTEYLPRTSRRTGHGGVGVWQLVLTRLCTNPPDPAAARLRRVLSTPLMVYLARTIYSDTPGRDPVELLDSDQFRTPQEVEKHLIGAYIPAVYQDRSATGRHWPAGRPQHWLTYLAGHLHRLGTQDLAWWQLRGTIPRPTRALLLGLAGGLMGGIANGAYLFGLLVGLGVGLNRDGPTPTRTHFKIRGETRDVFRLLAWGLGFGLVSGLLFGLLGGPMEPRIRLAGGLLVGTTVGLVFMLITGLTDMIESPINMSTVVSVGDSLRLDRSNTIRKILMVGLVFGFVGGIAGEIAGGIADGLVYGSVWVLTAGLAVGLTCAWGQWLVLVRVWLPLTGRLPWSVNAFLDDAYHRGVLYQAGAVYRFRHTQLQEQLTRPT